MDRLVGYQRWFYGLGALFALYGAFFGEMAAAPIFGFAVALIGTGLWGWIPPEWRGSVPVWLIAGAGATCVLLGMFPWFPIFLTLVVPLGISGIADIPRGSRFSPSPGLRRQLHIIAALVALGGAISCLALVVVDPLNVLFGIATVIGQLAPLFFHPLLVGAVAIWAIAGAGWGLTALAGAFIDLTWIVGVALLLYGTGNYLVYRSAR